MHSLIRSLLGVAMGLVLGGLAAHFLVAPRSSGRRQADQTVAPQYSNQTIFSTQTTVAKPTKAGGNAEAWERYLASVLPLSEPFGAARASETLTNLDRQAAHGNPIRAEVEREWLLFQVSVNDIAALSTKVYQWPNADTAFGPWRYLLRQWAAQDPKAALAFVKGLAPDDMGRGLELVLSKWVEVDPIAAFAYLESSKDRFLKTSGLGAAIHTLAASDPQEALARLDAVDPTQRRNLLGEIVSTWAAQDGAAAMDWLRRNDLGDAKDNLVNRVIQNWARKDPQKAVEYALGLPRGAIQEPYLANVFWEWATQNPQAAAQSLSTLPPERQSREVVESVAKGMAITQDFQQLLAWAERFPEGQVRDAFLAGLVKYGAANNIEFALSIVPRLAEGPIREGALSELADLWGRKDAPKTAEWLNTLPPSPSRDIAVVNFGLSITAIDARLAAQWLATIQDTKKRERYFGPAFEKWRGQDPQGAEAWLEENSAFSDQQKTKLLKVDR